MKQPHYQLDRVKTLVQNGQLWICKGRGLNHFNTPREGIEFAKRVTQILAERHFSETVSLHTGKADVYALRVDDVGWYIKLNIDEDGPETTFISLHPLEHPINTNAGRVEP